MMMADDGHIAEPLSPVRKVIAARMAEAARTIPHFRMSAVIEIDALQSLRAALRAEHGRCPTINAFIVKASALALIEVPALNIQWADQALHRFENAHVSIVTAIPGGLSTPIVRAANRKSVWQIADEAKQLATRALSQQLKLAEIFGGTFSVSNLGMFGVEQFDAIINPPQCAILAIGGAQPRLLPGAAGEPRLATTLVCTLSVDHRAIDGATAAAFMSAVRARLEDPARLASAPEVR